MQTSFIDPFKMNHQTRLLISSQIVSEDHGGHRFGTKMFLCCYLSKISEAPTEGLVESGTRRTSAATVLRRTAEELRVGGIQGMSGGFCSQETQFRHMWRWEHEALGSDSGS